MNVFPLIRKKLNQLSKDRRGQSTIEYILILFIVVMIAMKFKSIIGEKVVNLATKVGSDLDRVSQEE